MLRERSAKSTPLFLGVVPYNRIQNDVSRINDWYNIWLPDDAHKKRLQDTKAVYDVRIRY